MIIFIRQFSANFMSIAVNTRDREMRNRETQNST